jgi:hypothetical protein
MLLSTKYSWKIHVKLRVPVGTRWETTSAFYELELDHRYNKAYLL